MKRLRISAISFLNTAPLMWDFEHGEQRREFEIEYTVPSACAEALRSGAADIGIIPAISYQTIPNLLVIPEIAIASDGAVRSILLVSKIPLSKIGTVAVDTSSRTSVALLHVLFSNFWRRPETQQAASLPSFIPTTPNLNAMLAGCDAALLIGDPALTVDRSRYHVVDLGEEWKRLTGKPFVFAFWAVRRKAIENHPLAESLPQIFQRSRDHGLANVAAVARQWAPRLGISEDDVTRYLTRNVTFTLDQPSLEGLNLFYRLASECHLIPRAHPLAFLTSQPALPKATAS